MVSAYCEKCRKAVETTPVFREESYPVKGEKTTIRARVAVCPNCKESLFCEELDAKNLERAYSIYRQKHNLLTADGIKALREKYGLSQRALGALLGWGEITIHRYESGAIQDKAHNELLRLVEKPENMRDIAARNGAAIPVSALTALRARLNELVGQGELPLPEAIRAVTATDPANPKYTGGKVFNYDKFANIILYLMRATKGIYKTKLNKLMWYGDFLHFKQYGESITGAVYYNFPYGPVYRHYDLALAVMREQGLITSTEGTYNNKVVEHYSPCRAPNARSITAKERETLDAVLRKFRSYSAEEISKYSHREKPYRKTPRGRPIPYPLAVELSL